MTVRIHSQVLRELHSTARAHGSDECMGLLIGDPGEQAIAGAYLLEAESSPGHAEAEPITLKRAAAEIRAGGQIVRGIFHSHGKHPVFHSATDHATVARILPALAETNFERSGTRPTPWLAGPGHAVLPLADGRVRTYALSAPPDSLDPAPDWTHVRFERRETEKNTAVHTAESLVLAAGGLALTLGLPDGATLSAVVSDPATARLARLFSVVVNCSGDFEAMCLIVAEVGAESFEKLLPCEILAVEGDTEASGGRLLTLVRRRKVA